MQIDKALSAFRRGEFNMDAARIELEPLAVNAAAYSGPGFVKQLPGGGFELKCYANATPQAGLASFLGQPAEGEMYKDEHHYICRIYDHNGDVWETSPVILEMSYSFVMTAGTIGARTPRLVRKLGSKSSLWALRLEFASQVEGDWWTLLGEHRIDLSARKLSFSLDISEVEGSIVVLATSETELPVDFQSCLIQAISFVMCEEFSPIVSDHATPEGRSIRMASPGRLKATCPAFPPLDPRQSVGVAYLLSRYLDHVLGETTGDERLWHPLTASLSLARQATGRSQGAWIIGLSVAVEGVAKRIPAGPVISDTDFGALTAKVSAFLGREHYSETIIKRVDGMLKGMGSVSVKNRMYGLVNTGHVLEADIVAWSRLRNAAVHVRHSTADDFEDAEMQRQMDNMLAVQRLMYCLVFHIIGYTGKFTDYASRGFPEASYPFEVLPSTS